MTMPTFEPVAWKDTCFTSDENEVLTSEPILCGYKGWESIPDATDLFTESQLQQAYEAGKRDAVPEGWTAINLKTGNEYQVIGEATDATNMHCNQLMVIYQRDGKTFVREAEEFQEKFKAAPKRE